MDGASPYPTTAELERQYGIPPDTYCGLTPLEMSRAIIAYNSGPGRPGERVGYNPVGSPETRRDWLRREFGPDADIEAIGLRERFFTGRVQSRLALDWSLEDEPFDRAVLEGLRLHFPELTEEARLVLCGNFSYSHAK